MQDLAQTIRPYRADVALSRLGALGLFPRNSGAIISLELLANVALCSLRAASSGKSLARKDLAKLLRSTNLTQHSWRNDPDPGPLTQEVAYFGGAYRILTSQEKDLHVVLEALTSATELVGTNDERIAIKRTIRSVLAVSDTVLRSSGLERGIEGSDESVPTVPEEDVLDRLASATALKVSDLNHLLGSFGCSFADITPLTTSLGNHKLSEIDAEGRPLRDTPFVVVGGTLVVPAPSLIVPALARWILNSWISAGRRDQLATALEGFAIATARESLDALGLRHLSRPDSPPLPVGQAVWFRMDSDKVLAALILSDPLSDDEPTWAIPEADLAASVRAIEEYEASRGDSANGLLVLLVPQHYVRPYFAGIPAPTYARALAFSPGDLRTIRSLRESDPLSLWTYAETFERALRDTRIVTMDPLDAFAMYEQLGKSFRFADAPTPDLIVVTPGTARHLRMEAFHREDAHPRVDHERRVGLYVRTQQDVPIYARLRPLDPLQMAIELPRFTSFVSIRDPKDADRGAQYEMTELAAYWVWQIAREFGLHAPSLVVQLDVPDETWASWSTPTAGADNGGAPAIRSQVTNGRIALYLGPNVFTLLDGPDNRGERVLVSALAEAMFEIVDGVHPTPEVLAPAVDRVAPLGPKKKMVIFSSPDTVTRLDPRGLPRPRLLQDAASNRVHSELIPGSLAGQGVAVGPIPDTRRDAILKQLVADLFGMFERIVRTLRRDELMRCLLVMDDALFTEYERQRRLIPTEMACFADVPRAERRLAETMPRLSTTALAHRFLVEYVAAQPPDGPRPFSTSVYDELVATAAALIALANDDDLIHYGLIKDLNLVVGADGRLAKDEGAAALAREAFASAYAGQELRRSLDSFARLWRVPNGEQEGPPEQVDRAFRAEFGWTLRELADAWRVLLELQDVQGAPQPFSTEELAATLDAECSCGVDRARSLLQTLALEQRAAFTALPDGYQLPDVLPWRFSRGLSLLRRPLVAWNESGDVAMYWTRKAVLRASDYLFNAVFDRRIKAESPEMLALMGELGAGSGKAWTAEVERTVRAHLRLVRTNVDKVGKLRLLQDGRNLGDIDVLAYDDARNILWAIETKNFEAARTPYEARSELMSFEDAVKKHEALREWLSPHSLYVATSLLGHSPASPPELRTPIVVSSESFVRHLRTFGLPLMTLTDLVSELSA